jgi:hypothetical protein
MIKLTTLSFESEIIGELAANNFLFPSNRYTMPQVQPLTLELN